MRSRSPFTFGLMLLAAGLFFLGFAFKIQNRGLGHNNDPGPRLFPTALAACLVLGGMGYIASGVFGRRRVAPETPAASGKRASQPGVVLLAAIAVYALAMPWAGFALSTFLFAAGMMFYLRVRWILAIAVAIALVSVIHLLFVMLFKVQLPAGVFG